MVAVLLEARHPAPPAAQGGHEALALEAVASPRQELRRRGPPSLSVAPAETSSVGVLSTPAAGVGTPGFLPPIFDPSTSTLALRTPVSAVASRRGGAASVRAHRRSHERRSHEGGDALALDSGGAALDEPLERTAAVAAAADDAEELALSLLQVTSKPPQKRTTQDLKQLQMFTRNVKFFKELNDASLHLELCRHLFHQDIADGTPVFRQGDEGNRFYIIFQGAVKVFVQAQQAEKKAKAAPAPPPKKKLSLKDRLKRGVAAAKGGDAPPKMDLFSLVREAKNTLEDKYGSCVATLEDGASFGELALLGNGLRAASVVPIRDTQFLWVEKAAYDRCIRQAQEEELRMRLAFLKTVFLFEGWSDDDLARLAKVLTKKRYPKNAVIIQQGTMTDCMYFLLSGRCRVLKNCELPPDLQDTLAASREGAGIQRLLAADGQEGRSVLGSPRGPPPISPSPAARRRQLTASPRIAAIPQAATQLPPGAPQANAAAGDPLAAAGAAAGDPAQPPPRATCRRGSVLTAPLLDVSRNKDALGAQAATPRGRVGVPVPPPPPDRERVVLEIGGLGPRQYFGDLALMEAQQAGPGKKVGQHSASIVTTTEASCLLLSKYDFYHFIGGEGRTADLLRQYAEKFYMMSEASMRRSIRKGSKWDGYKRSLLHEVSSPR